MKALKKAPLYLIFAAMPLITMALISLIFRIDPRNTVLVAGDEITWYSLVRSVVAFGRPLGYYGYAGSHAAYGTFSTWGPAQVYAMSLIPRITGMTMQSPILTNVVYACAANLLFVLFTQPEVKSALRLILISFLTYVSFQFIFTGMSETTRFSMGIILTGILWYLWKNASKGKIFYGFILYVLAPLLILAFSACYILFTIAVPVWFLCLSARLGRKKKKKFLFWFFYWILAVILSALIVAGMYFFRSKVIAPYISSTTGDFIAAFRQGLRPGLDYARGLLIRAWNNLNPLALYRMRGEHHGFYTLTLFFYYAVILLSLIRMLLCIGKKYKHRDCFAQYLTSFLLLTSFLFAFIFLYTTEPASMIRGLNIAFVPALYLLCLGEKDSIITYRLAIILLIGMYSFGINFSETAIPGRYDAAAAARIEEVENTLSRYIVLDPQADPSENTVQLYGDLTPSLMGLPAGAGINAMLWLNVVEPEYRYALLNLESPGGRDMETTTLLLTDRGYKELYNDGALAVYANR